MGIPIIDQLGERIDESWRACDYDFAHFSELCAAQLEHAAVHRALEPRDIIEWTLGARLPQQFDPLGVFGQPPVTLFRAPRFVIDALFWLDGTTNIHDHGFSGAFTVLAGSSIETTFSFTPDRSTGGQLELGRLDLVGATLRRAGDVRPIEAGPRYIHSLFHLARPSVTLLVRALEQPISEPPLEYFPCGIAFNRFHRDETLDRVLEIVGLLDALDDATFLSRIGDLIAQADLYTAFRVVRRCVDIPDTRRTDELLSRVRDPAVAQTFSSWLATERKLRFLRKRRGLVRDPDLRFFLAVLLNCQRGAESMALVSDFDEGKTDPAARVASWLAGLAQVKMSLQAGGQPWEPNVLGLPDFEDGFEPALSDCLARRPRSFTDAERSFLDRLRSLPFLTPLFPT